MTSLKGAMSPGGTPYYRLYGEAPPEKIIFFRLQVYERVGISLVEVQKSGIGNRNRSFGPERANRLILWLYKVEKRFYSCD